ncbi:MAG: shikimate kinase [Bacteroidota bacterium]
MKIYIVGIGCVGKTTIGKLLADYLNITFYDLDAEVEEYYQKSIERLQNECFTMNGYRKKASVVLDQLLKIPENAVISGTPSGLRDAYLQVYKKHKKVIDITSVNIIDTPQNILNRLTFYDVDSKLLDIELDEDKKRKYFKKIVGDWNYFKKSLSRADLQINIENVGLTQIPGLIVKELEKIDTSFSKNLK